MFDERSIDASSIDAIRFKIVFVGDVSVGKTSIMNRFLNNEFSNDYDPSIGVDFHPKVIMYKNKSIKLQFWDSAGQEKYKSLIPSYVRGASIIFIIFDLSSIQSFENIPNWIDFIKSIRTDNAILVLCGNKSDLELQVSNEKIIDYAKKESLFYFEVSALKNQGISNMMYSVVAELPIYDNDEDNIDKKKVASDLEAYNKPNVNISVISNIDINKNEIENEQENNTNNTNKVNLNQNMNKSNLNNFKAKKDKKKCC